MPVVEPAALLQPALLQEETITDENLAIDMPPKLVLRPIMNDAVLTP